MAKSQGVKIVVDTNWYISATINRKSRRILFDLITNPNITILYSDELLQEYRNVISRPGFLRLVTEDQVLRFIGLVLSRLQNIKPTTSVNLSRDKADDHLISLAIDGKASYLVTSDNDLLVLRQVGMTKIVKMSEFREIFRT